MSSLVLPRNVEELGPFVEIQYVVEFPALAQNQIATQTINFAVPLGGFIVGVTGSSDADRSTWDVNLNRQQGQNLTTAFVAADASLGTGENPYNWSAGPVGVDPNGSWTVQVRMRNTAGSSQPTFVVFYVIQRYVPQQKWKPTHGGQN